MPGAYRGVAVTAFDGELDEGSLARHFVGREAYRRTRFIVVRNGGETAIVAVQKESDEPLFSPITAMQLLVGPAECAYVEDPEVDTAVPTALARAALSQAPGKRGVVVQGRYAHVSFIIDPVPLRVTVREVVPPYPAKLLDQAQRVLGLAETLPPMELVARRGRIRSARAGQYGHQLPAALSGRWRLHRGGDCGVFGRTPGP